MESNTNKEHSMNQPREQYVDWLEEQMAEQSMSGDEANELLEDYDTAVDGE